jgi:hypothetical protein
MSEAQWNGLTQGTVYGFERGNVLADSFEHVQPVLTSRRWTHSDPCRHRGVQRWTDPPVGQKEDGLRNAHTGREPSRGQLRKVVPEIAESAALLGSSVRHFHHGQVTQRSKRFGGSFQEVFDEWRLVTTSCPDVAHLAAPPRCLPAA